jgi:DNA-binding response OmpR family regulator
MPMNAGTILVAEDSYQIRYLIQYLLEREQYRVEAAADGRAAERLIDTIARPSLVILDIMLPHIDGLQLLQRIRSRDDWAGIPVIMLTGKSQEHDIARALEAGASDYMVKPFQPNALVALVKRWASPGAP